MERGTKKKGDGTYEVGQMMIRSSEEGLRSSSTHAVTRKKKTTLELNWGFRNQEKIKARWRQRKFITHHKSRKSGELGSAHCYIRDFITFGKSLNWFLRCQQYLGSNGHSSKV